jgi:FkbM family methyltransferase
MQRLIRAVERRTRQRFPERRVRRVVNGVPLLMPWLHRLPDFTDEFPLYGRNLIELARAVSTSSVPLTMIDLGANIGDSALAVLAEVDARVLCVDGDPYWLPFLAANTQHDQRIEVAPVLLRPDGEHTTLRVERRGGTSRFAPVEGGDVLDGITVRELLQQWPGYEQARLVKSDTDGYDTRLIVEFARVLMSSKPVLFFEYDPAMTRGAGEARPDRVWGELESLGYDFVIIWDNFGRRRRSAHISRLPSMSLLLDGPRGQRDHDYWDVAVLHRNDATLHGAFVEAELGLG